MNIHKLTWLLPKGGMIMLKDYTDAWLDLMEDSFTIPEEEEPMDDTQTETHYQSVYQGWIVPRPSNIPRLGNKSGKMR